MRSLKFFLGTLSVVVGLGLSEFAKGENAIPAASLPAHTSLKEVQKGFRNGLRPFLGPYEIPSGDPKRPSAKVYLPKSYETSKQNWPLVVLLHGYTGTADLENAYFGLSLRTSLRGFILVTPEGYTDQKGNQFWNATDACCDFDGTKVDDVGYLEKLISELESKYRVDPKRRYLIGHSNGGFMAHRLACSDKNLFSGFATLAGVMAKNPTECRATEPVSVLHIHAEDDATILYAGSEHYPSARQTQEFWAKHNQCNPKPTAGFSLDMILSLPAEDTTVLSWTDCAKESKVRLWTIKPSDALSWKAHNPHIPVLGLYFTDKVLDFLMK